MGLKILCFLAGFVLAAVSANAQNSTEAGKFFVEHPTLVNLGFEWAIRGDENRNASVDVQFRAAGETVWRRRCRSYASEGRGSFALASTSTYVVPDGFAGSILNLQPGTEYECRFELKIPTARQDRRATPCGSRREPSHSVRAKAERCTCIRPIIRDHDRNPASPACCRPTTEPASAIGASCGNVAPNRATRSSCTSVSTNLNG